MIMKVFNKGQVVIPAEIRRALDIAVGDMVDVKVDEQHRTVELRKVESFEADSLAGSLAEYGRGKRLPSGRDMAAALRKGLASET